MALPADYNKIRDPESQSRVVTRCFVKKEKKHQKRGSFATNHSQAPKRFSNYLRRISVQNLSVLYTTDISI